MRTYTFHEVQQAGNDPEVAFTPDTVFVLTYVPVGSPATLQSYIDEHDWRFAYSILDMILTIEHLGVSAIPPVVANRTGHVEDGAHRLAALHALGIENAPAFVEYVPTTVTNPTTS